MGRTGGTVQGRYRDDGDDDITNQDAQKEECYFWFSVSIRVKSVSGVVVVE